VNDPFSLAGRTVLITGAAGAIGGATARLCARQGADLVLCDLAAPAELAAELRAGGRQARAVALDVRDRAATEALVAGCGRLDAVVANAGRCRWDDWLDDDWDEEFRTTIDVNLFAPIHLARAVLPRMIDAGGGSLVLVSSVAGRMGGLRASPHYVAAKGGVVTLVKWLAKKAGASGVRVNGVAPGATVSAMTAGQSFDVAAIPMGRLAEPREIAGPIAFLCSDAASYISGCNLDVNGGVFMA
jgi:NAD(P)-dependent dehydrogenase (short-subunit alcohol dehydrogenase family)